MIFSFSKIAMSSPNRNKISYMRVSYSEDSNVQYALVSEGDDLADKPIPDIWACSTCYVFVGENMPDNDLRDLVETAKRDDELAAELKVAVAEAETGSQSECYRDREPPRIDLTEMEDMGYIIADTCELLTYYGYKSETGKCPKVNNAKSILKRNFQNGSW